MNTTQRYCAVCQKPLPEKATASRQYCDSNCRKRAARKRAKGKPIADPTATPEEIATLKLQLVQQQETIVQLQKEAAKLHKRIATAQRKAATATATIATRDQQFAAQQEQHTHNLQAAFDRAQTRNEELRQLYVALRERNQELEQQVQRLQKLDQLQEEKTNVAEYAIDLTRMYEALYRRWYIQQVNYIRVCKDFLDFEYYVRTTKPEFKISPQDFDRFKRAKNLRKKMPTMPRKQTIPMPKSTPKEYLQ